MSVVQEFGVDCFQGHFGSGKSPNYSRFLSEIGTCVGKSFHVIQAEGDTGL